MNSNNNNNTLRISNQEKEILDKTIREEIQRYINSNMGPGPIHSVNPRIQMQNIASKSYEEIMAMIVDNEAVLGKIRSRPLLHLLGAPLTTNQPSVGIDDAAAEEIRLGKLLRENIEKQKKWKERQYINTALAYEQQLRNQINLPSSTPLEEIISIIKKNFLLDENSEMEEETMAYNKGIRLLVQYFEDAKNEEESIE